MVRGPLELEVCVVRHEEMFQIVFCRGSGEGGGRLTCDGNSCWVFGVVLEHSSFYTLYNDIGNALRIRSNRDE